MEILLLIAIIAVAASGLFVAVTLKLRIMPDIELLINKAAGTTRKEIDESSKGLGKRIRAITEELPQDREQVLKQIQAASAGLTQQVQAITGELRQDRELLKQIEATSAGLTQQIQAITGELRQDRELLNRLDGQINTRQNQLARGLQGLDRRVGQLHESVDWQGSKVAAIYSYTKRQDKHAESSSEPGSLVLAMLEVESNTENQGWGKPARLYALTKQASSVEKTYEHGTEMRDARPEALVPVEQDPLPDGNLIEVLASTHWQEDVVGCVLVTELTDLPPGDGESAFVDPLAAGQWASTHPDGRPARLAVGVSRNGEHTCGLRVKGENDVQIRTELAEDLVRALLETF